MGLFDVTAAFLSRRRIVRVAARKLLALGGRLAENVLPPIVKLPSSIEYVKVVLSEELPSSLERFVTPDAT